ncbi:MAG: TIGR01777 family protein [Halobacteriovoraceae bacterium]|nr:TIGR01777 family protein [Halobacteriovoraceae bacterium]|tara:strand:- start:20260 stop:21159 length:900 start_codon:yes stop_codon:yes gene_type:complete
MKYLITGGTGFVGQHLVKELLSSNHEVSVLARDIEKAQEQLGPQVTVIHWPDVYSDFEIESNEFDCVINLMGANIAGKKWSNERKKVLYNSRVDGTRNLIEKLDAKNISVKKFVQASAIGIYDEKSDVIFEDSPVENDFLGKLCQDWEKQLTDRKDNYAILRFGMVLGKDGGAMKKMLPAFKLGLGGKLGSGKFYMSWIHIQDLVHMLIKASQDENMNGVYNAVSQYPVTNKEFTNVLSDLLQRPAVFKVPKTMLQLVLGEMSQVLLADLRVKSKRIKEVKFVFTYPTIENALKEVVSK